MGEVIDIVAVGESDDAVALAVGRIVLAATTLDYWACHVVAGSLGGSDDQWERWFGQSGERLICGLAEAGERDDRVLALAAPMDSVVRRRNQVVHGMFFGDPERGPDAYESVRPVRKSVGSDDRAITLDDLAVLREDIRTLDIYCIALHMAIRPPVQYGTGVSVEPIKVRLPSLEGIAAREWPLSAD